MSGPTRPGEPNHCRACADDARRARVAREYRADLAAYRPERMLGWVLLGVVVDGLLGVALLVVAGLDVVGALGGGR